MRNALDVAPSGADRVINRRSYKDFAPTELVASKVARVDSQNLCAFASLREILSGDGKTIPGVSDP